MQEEGNMETITVEEQTRMGLRTPAASRFTPALVRREAAPAPPINANISHTIDVPPSATQHVELRTSAVDRALGFAIATSPLAAGFAVVVVGICALGFGVPLLSLPTLVIAFTVFAVVWTVAYLYTLSISAEGVSMYEAQQRWGVIRDEHRMRWQAWFLEMGHNGTDNAI